MSSINRQAPRNPNARAVPPPPRPLPGPVGKPGTVLRSYSCEAESPQKRNQAHSLAALTPRNRLYISLGVFAFAAAGLYLDSVIMPEPDVVHVVPAERADDRNRLKRPSEDNPS